MIRLQAKDIEEIKQIAQETYPHECCGLLVGSVDNGVKTVTEFIPAENQRTDSPANRYLMTADLLNEVEKKLKGTGFAILGFFHSHPDVPARPSTYDQEHAWPWYSYLIVSVSKGKAGEFKNWRLKDDRSAFDPEKVELL
ncbi:MAG: M67 family metallopeptidase [Acidobacteria bacterium]|nr:M67 family metallopeptidase [Acidobacteriota bacterium]MCZ6768964.1 M67 family metallopeptidase [Acidobacteriota bacterium]